MSDHLCPEKSINRSVNAKVPVSGHKVNPHYLIALSFVGLICADLVIGGGGRLVSIGPLSLRMLLFLMAIFLIGGMAATDRNLGIMTAKTLFWILALVGFYGAIGILRGSSVGNIFGDANFLVIFFYVPLIFMVFRRSKLNIVWFFDYLILLIFLFSLVTILLVGLHFMNIVNLQNLDVIFKDFAYGGNTGMMRGQVPRIYTSSHIFLQFGFSILLAEIIFFETNAKKIFFLITISLALLFTFTRGFWLGAAISGFALGVQAGFRKSVKLVAVGLVLVLIVAGIAIFSGVYSGETLINRVSITNENGESNTGDLVRLLQFVYALQQIEKHPVLGLGFGAKMPEGYLAARETLSGRSKEPLEDTGVSIELTYVNMLRKFGLVGLAAFLIFTTLLLRRVYTRAKFIKKDHPQMYSLYIGYMAAVLGFLATAGTNPYLFNASGAFVFVILICLVMISGEFKQGFLEHKHD